METSNCETIQVIVKQYKKSCEKIIGKSHQSRNAENFDGMTFHHFKRLEQQKNMPVDVSAGCSRKLIYSENLTQIPITFHHVKLFLLNVNTSTCLRITK